MYEARQNKEKVSRRIDGGSEILRRKKKIEKRTTRYSHNVFENIWINRNNSVQFYTENNGIKVSENNKYATNDNNKNVLYLNNRIANVPRPLPNEFFYRSEHNEFYDTYVPNTDLVSGQSVDSQQNYPPMLLIYYGANDCGYYAGALANNNKNWQDGAGFKSMKIKEKDKGMHAASNIGEAYYIYPTVSDNDRDYTGARHHVATVVAQDGADRITSEADCGDNRTKPYFEMYGTKTETKFETSQTFAWRYKGYFNSKDSNLRNGIDAKVDVLTKSVPADTLSTDIWI